jgi:hypothetical protein
LEIRSKLGIEAEAAVPLLLRIESAECSDNSESTLDTSEDSESVEEVQPEDTLMPCSEMKSLLIEEVEDPIVPAADDPPLVLRS